jgi:hypothetical protein
MAYNANEVSYTHFTYYQFVSTTHLAETFQLIFQYAIPKQPKSIVNYHIRNIFSFYCPDKGN